jgi:hypothetical protein
MNPMSLMTLPASALKAVYQRGMQRSTQGERSERVLANVGLLLILLMTLAMIAWL